MFVASKVIGKGHFGTVLLAKFVGVEEDPNLDQRCM